MVAQELHMDDIHGATPSGRDNFVKDLALEIHFKGGDRCETGRPYEHLKRLRLPMTGETRTQPNPKYLESFCEPAGTDRCEDTTDSWCTVTSCDNGCYTSADS